MSLRAHLWALDSAPVENPAAALILAALADEANDDGEGACPYMEKLTHRGRCAERTAQGHLRELFRLRLISGGDPAIARRRYRKPGGKVPRVWNLNLAASWDSVPTPRSDEEMREYSDRIGQRPARRAADEPEQYGVQNLHPIEDVDPDQGELADVDDDDSGSADPWGADGRTSWGADPEPDGVQTSAPFPSPAYNPITPPLVDQPTSGSAASPHSGQRGEGSPPKKKTSDRLGEIVEWFARRRTDWDRAAIEDALTVAVARELGTLDEAAQALRELAEGKHGATDSPRRLYALPSADWWASSRTRRSRAAAAKLASSPRCSRRGHEQQSAGGCKLCLGEAKGRMDEDHPLPPDEALARGTRFLPRSRRRGEPAEESVAS